MTEQDEKFMRRAIELAQRGMENGAGGPFGCVIVKDGEIVGEGCNRVTSTNDPTAHAEVVAIREACRNLNSFQLELHDLRELRTLPDVSRRDLLGAPESDFMPATNRMRQ